MMYPRNSPLPDESVAGLLGLADLRIGRHPVTGDGPPGGRDLWVQSVWRARVLPAFDADAFLAVMTCAAPWQPGADPRQGFAARCGRLVGLRPAPPTVAWRKAVLSLQGETTVTALPRDAVAAALRGVDLFEPYEYGSLDGIGYSLDVETWSTRACLAFSNPEVPSLRRVARALLAVGREVARASGNGPVSEYLKVWARYES